MIHYFPLQAHETRYTGHLDRSIVSHLESSGKPYIRYDPRTSRGVPPHGHFFDASSEIEHRSLQLAEFSYQAWLGEEGGFENGDIVFFSDVLLPGVEAVAYLAELLGVKALIRGLLHGGSYGDHDLMHKAERWARFHEEAVFEICDEIYLGSEFHRQDVLNKRSLGEEGKLIVTGHLIDPDLGRVIVRQELRPLPDEPGLPIVVFNSRLSPDKQPWLFRKLADRLNGKAECVVALEQNLSKEAYYDLLARAKVVVSFALHETFGVGVQEAVKLGCVPVVPNRCCYPEQFDSPYRYETFEDAATIVELALTGWLEPPAPVDYSNAVERWFADA